MMFIMQVILISNKTIAKTHLRSRHLPEQPLMRKEKKCRRGPLTPVIEDQLMAVIIVMILVIVIVMLLLFSITILITVTDCLHLHHDQVRIILRPWERVDEW